MSALIVLPEMNYRSLVMFVVIAAQFGCARKNDVADYIPMEHQCANFRPDFQAFMDKRATRLEVEDFMKARGDIERITSTTELNEYRKLISPEAIDVFQKHYKATYAGMECDNQFIVFFDDEDRMVRFEP